MPAMALRAAASSADVEGVPGAGFDPAAIGGRRARIGRGGGRHAPGHRDRRAHGTGHPICSPRSRRMRRHGPQPSPRWPERRSASDSSCLPTPSREHVGSSPMPVCGPGRLAFRVGSTAVVSLRLGPACLKRSGSCASLMQRRRATRNTLSFKAVVPMQRGAACASCGPIREQGYAIGGAVVDAVHATIQAWAGSLWNFQIRFGPAMTLR